jgi:hypothetical protein
MLKGIMFTTFTFIDNKKSVNNGKIVDSLSLYKKITITSLLVTGH